MEKIGFEGVVYVEAAVDETGSAPDDSTRVFAAIEKCVRKAVADAVVELKTKYPKCKIKTKIRSEGMMG